MVNQSRPRVVSAGTLSLLQKWLEYGILYLTECLSIDPNIMNRNNNMNHNNLSQNNSNNNLKDNNKDTKETEMKDKDKEIISFEENNAAYELIRYTSLSIMLIVGGIDILNNNNNITYNSTINNTNIHRNTTSNGGYDYTVGWLDAKILAQSLPQTIVNFLNISINLHNLYNNILIPNIIVMYLSQILYQLTSRMPNRIVLSNNQTPLALCNLFASIVIENRSKYLITSSSIPLNIKITPLQQSQSQTQSQTASNIIRSFSFTDRNSNHSNHSSSKSTNVEVNYNINHNNSSRYNNDTNNLNSNTSSHSSTIIDEEMLFNMIISSIVSNCLDALTYYLADVMN